MPTTHLSLPDPGASEQAAQALPALKALLQSCAGSSAHLRASFERAGVETQILIPIEALTIFVEVLSQLAQGHAVTVAPVHAELTTQQAADLLNVSRPYLIKLLDEGKIPHRRVGNRRKVLLADLLEYKRRDDEYRQKILAELTSEAQELGLDY